MIMVIYASTTPGYTQKELTADLTLWVQLLVLKAPRSRRKSSPPPPGLITFQYLAATPILSLLRVELCARPLGTLCKVYNSWEARV